MAKSAGLSEYADAVVDAVGERAGLVVVAHSLGGFTAPLVCARVPVDLLVLVAGMVPAPGETSRSGGPTRTGSRRMRRRARFGHDASDTAVFLHDVAPDLAAEALAKARNQSRYAAAGSVAGRCVAGCLDQVPAVSR
jgi:alpha-beta hydrolase superfamily lysophospholipase